MPYLQESLSEGERIVRVFRQHRVTRIRLVIWILLIVTIPIAIYEWLRLRSIEHGLTNKRVIYKRGISDVVLRTIDDPLEVKRQIESVSHPAA